MNKVTKKELLERCQDNTRAIERLELILKQNGIEWITDKPKQNSLIERESKELTGSDLCRAMLARGDKFVLCNVSNNGQYFGSPSIVKSYRDDEGTFEIVASNIDSNWLYVQPINNQGEPLTAADVGL